jgi:hypothetical protein
VGTGIALPTQDLEARWGGWLTPRPGRFSPREDSLYALYRRLGEPHGRSGRLRKIWPPLHRELLSLAYSMQDI